MCVSVNVFEVHAHVCVCFRAVCMGSNLDVFEVLVHTHLYIYLCVCTYMCVE